MASSSDKTDVFLTLLISNQRQLSSYINMLVPNFNDADDILQETISVMWKKFDQYAAGTDFAAWGIRIAYYNILHYRREKSKKIIQFNDELFSRICEAAEKKYSKSDSILRALRECIKKLEKPEQQLLKIRYELNSSVTNAARRTGKSIPSVYRMLARIHHILHNCIRRTLIEEGASS